MPPRDQGSSCTVGTCSRTVPPGMYVCDADAQRLMWNLLGVASLGIALEAAHVKLLRFGPSQAPAVRPADDESPLPYSDRASAAHRELVAVLTEWAELADPTLAADPRPLTLARLGPLLARQVPRLRTSPHGGEAVERIMLAIREAARAVDRPADRRYAGPCQGERVVVPFLHGGLCGSDLYATPGRPDVTCRDCGATYPITERRAWLLEAAAEALLPATELARAIDGLGVDVTPAMIRRWASRGLIERKGVRRRRVLSRQDEDPVYRVGDVLDKVAADHAARLERMGGPIDVAAG